MKNFLVKNPEKIGGEYSPILLQPVSLAKFASRINVIQEVIEILEKLSEDTFTQGMIETYRQGINLLGDDWEYLDITNSLYGISKLGQPENYLEIGVRRGRSVCIVGAASPNVNIYGFDLWQEGYGGNDNPGSDFVKTELSRLGHRGKTEFISGDSHVTVPQFLKNNPNLTFDLITVDGDHSLTGALDDLTNVVDRLRVGGVIVFDDIDNPYCPGLDNVWQKFLKMYPSLEGCIFRNPIGLGVALGIRKRPPSFDLEGQKKWFKWR
ncbi:class I SAM-dependent methyltransferase [Pseudanabaena mucicola]|uniref:Class I SAM-dependent methyltransferase n=1 Tax=Pseudanabaena mucicola FACHB-723 TaxID=2692860 RepID=A0ABR7ZSZ5_9CYAN|nr:class I SAM-dependent methyltransferase [Pseudanabaena mucicola]MBD2187098.1 class I SAM-dependent methyltransferase [Pseudanabaena mucicola FACHB-723]